MSLSVFVTYSAGIAGQTEDKKSHAFQSGDNGVKISNFELTPDDASPWHCNQLLISILFAAGELDDHPAGYASVLELTC